MRGHRRSKAHLRALRTLFEHVARYSQSDLELRVTLDRVLEEAELGSELASRAHEEYAAMLLAQQWHALNPTPQALWQALRHLRVVIQNGHERDRVHALMAMAWGRLGYLRLASQSYRRAILLNPNVWAYHFNLGVILRDALGDTQQAEFHLRRANTLRSRQPTMTYQAQNRVSCEFDV